MLHIHLPSTLADNCSAGKPISLSFPPARVTLTWGKFERTGGQKLYSKITPLWQQGRTNPVGVGAWKYLLRFPSAEFCKLVSTSYLEIMYKNGVNRWTQKGKPISMAVILRSAIYNDDHYSHCLIGLPCNEGTLEMIKQHWKFWFNEVRGPSYYDLKCLLIGTQPDADGHCYITSLHRVCHDRLLTFFEL